MSRKKHDSDARARKRAARRMRYEITALMPPQGVDETRKFIGSVVVTLIVGGLATIVLSMLESSRAREGEQLRITSEAVSARQDALEDFGTRIHAIIEAHYDALLAEVAWQDTIQSIGPALAEEIEFDVTLARAQVLVQHAPNRTRAMADADAVLPAEHAYANYLVKRDLSVRAGSGQALCVALMSRLRTQEARQAVAQLKDAMRDLENGEGLPESSAPADGAGTAHAMFAGGHAPPCEITRTHELVRRVSGALDNAYQEISHELTTESLSIWSVLDDDRTAARGHAGPRPDGVRRERWNPGQADGPLGAWRPVDRIAAAGDARPRP